MMIRKSRFFIKPLRYKDKRNYEIEAIPFYQSFRNMAFCNVLDWW
jgi:hypothetical protein